MTQNNSDSKLSSKKLWTKIEKRFAVIRNERCPVLRDFERVSELDHSTIKEIETSGNYTFSSLMKFLEAVNCHLVVDGTVVYNLEMFGKKLSDVRSRDYSIRDYAKACKISPGAVISIEKGRGCSKATFIKYLSNLCSVDFSIEEVTF